VSGRDAGGDLHRPQEEREPVEDEAQPGDAQRGAEPGEKRSLLGEEFARIDDGLHDGLPDWQRSRSLAPA
jgi:hypothetical protein